MAQPLSQGFETSGIRRRPVWILAAFAVLACLAVGLTAAVLGHQSARSRAREQLLLAARLLEPAALQALTPPAAPPPAEPPPPAKSPPPSKLPTQGPSRGSSPSPAPAASEPESAANEDQMTAKALTHQLESQVAQVGRQLSEITPGAVIQVFDAQRVVLAQSGLPPAPPDQRWQVKGEVLSRAQRQAWDLQVPGPWSRTALTSLALGLVGARAAYPLDLVLPLQSADQFVGGIELQVDAQPLVVAAVRQPLGYLLAPAAVLLLLAVLLGLWEARREYRPLQEIRDCINRVSEGDYSRRVQLSSGDELQELGDSLNTMLDRVGDLIETEADRDRLQKHIVGFLERVSQASEGDLTARAEVTADVLGSVADAYNLMLDSIGGLIRQVADAASQVARAAEHITSAAAEVNQGAAAQAREINGVVARVGEISASTQQALVHADDTTVAAKRATEVSVKGAQAVKNTIQGMNRIRANVQATARKIKALGEKSIEINTIVEVIDEISAQTNMLALNAAIEASRAGEHGKGFVVVADEVRKLAERSIRATKDIEKLVAGIQVETNEAVTAMEESIHEVESGSVLADQAGLALGEIESVVHHAAGLVGQISGSIREQVGGNQSVLNAMQQVYNITKSTVERARMTAQTIQRLAELSSGLEATIGRFKIEGAGEAHRGALAQESAAAAPPTEKELADMLDFESLRVDVKEDTAAFDPEKGLN